MTESKVPELYCDECKFLSPIEQEQTSKKEHHWCRVYKIIVYHLNEHPRIPTPFCCMRYSAYEQGKSTVDKRLAEAKAVYEKYRNEPKGSFDAFRESALWHVIKNLVESEEGK